MSAAQLLKRHNISPKKSLGQNFLVDERALARVADAASLKPGEAVLEIGAGLGHLTQVLAERVGSAGEVVAVEIDQRLMPLLRMRLASYQQVNLVLGDMLELEPGPLMNRRPYKVAANVPYYITSALLRYLLESEYQPRLMALTVQREVAERITAKPGQMSLLAVSVQIFGSVSIIRHLKAGAFYPRPNVTSSIIRITPHSMPVLPVDERSSFFRIVRAGFAQKRKQIKNSLQSVLALQNELVVNALAVADIDASRRAETLSLDEWLALYQAFQ